MLVYPFAPVITTLILSPIIDDILAYCIQGLINWLILSITLLESILSKTAPFVQGSPFCNFMYLYFSILISISHIH